jgi:hypothetical protein
MAGLLFGLAITVGWRVGTSGPVRREGAQQRAAQCQFLLAHPIRQEAELPNAYKTRGQDMEQKAPHELRRVQGHRLDLTAVGVVFPSESDPAIL